MKNNKDNSYKRMLYGISFGLLIGTFVTLITKIIYFLPLCVLTMMTTGYIISSNNKN